MIVSSSYGSILSSVFLIFLGKFVKCEKTKFTYDDSRLADRESYLSRNSLDYNSSNSTSSVQNQLRTQGNEQTNKSQANSSSKPGTTQYHWYFYDYDHDQNSDHENENLNQVDIQPEIHGTYGSHLPTAYGIDYHHHSPYGYMNNEVFHPPLTNYPNFFYQKLFLKKLFSILGPVLFPLPFFLALMPLAIPAIPLALFVGRIHGDSPVTPTIPTLSTTVPILTTEEQDSNSSSSSMSSSSSSSFTQTHPTQPSPGTTNPQPPDSMSSNSNSSFSSSSSSSGMMTPEMPQPTMMSTMSSENGTDSTTTTMIPSRPPGIGFPTFPPFPPPFPFLFLNNTFDDMHYYRKNKLIF